MAERRGPGEKSSIEFRGRGGSAELCTWRGSRNRPAEFAARATWARAGACTTASAKYRIGFAPGRRQQVVGVLARLHLELGHRRRRRRVTCRRLISLGPGGHLERLVSPARTKRRLSQVAAADVAVAHCASRRIVRAAGAAHCGLAASRRPDSMCSALGARRPLRPCKRGAGLRSGRPASTAHRPAESRAASCAMPPSEPKSRPAFGESRNCAAQLQSTSATLQRPADR